MTTLHEFPIGERPTVRQRVTVGAGYTGPGVNPRYRVRCIRTYYKGCRLIGRTPFEARLMTFGTFFRWFE